MPRCVRHLFSALLAVAVALGCASPREERAALLFDLHLDQAVERQLDGGETHTYRLPLATGDYVAVAVDQRGADVFATWRDPRGLALFEVDSPNGTRGPEWVVVQARDQGEHRLEVTAFEDSAGHYAVRLEALRPATADDLLRARGADAFRRAEMLRNDGRAAYALAHYRQALEQWEGVGERRWQALALERLGRAHADIEAWPAAAAAFRRAETLFTEAGDLNHRAIALGRLGQALYQLGDVGEALDIFAANVEVWRQLGRRREEAVALSDLGLAHLRLGELQAALEAYDLALPLLRDLGDIAYQATALSNLGLIHSFLGRYRRALDFLQEAASLSRQTGDLRSQAIILDLLGQVYHELGQLQLARQHLEQALALKVEVDDREGRAVTLANLALVAKAEGHSARALELYREAQAIFAELGLVRHQTRVLKNLGAIHAAAGRVDEALALLHRGLELQRKTRDPLTGAELWAEIAETERRGGDLEAARRAFEEALALHEKVRGNTPGQDLKASYFASLQEDYAAYVDLLVELDSRQAGAGHAAAALTVNERARARSLLELVGHTHGGDPELRARQRRLQAALNAVAAERAALEPGDPRSGELDRELRSASEELSRLRGELRSLGDARPLAAEEIVRQVLDPETLLLEVGLGAKRSIFWLLGSDGLETFEIASGAEIEAAARRAYHFLGRSHRRESTVTAAGALCRLSRLVLAPVAARLGDKRLLVVAGGALGYVPLAALPEPEPGGGCGAEPLLVAHEIVHLPSASTLGALRSAYGERPHAAGTLAVVADPAFAAGSLERLPHTRREAETLLAIAGPERSFAVLGAQATKKVVTGGALAGYRVVHFATHGTIDAEHPDLSSLALAELDAEGRLSDGRLRLHEIYGLELDAEVVVLSACRTALGPEVRGEGLVGFVQGFFHAGAERVVVSLWDVDDRVTARLMEGFYRRYLEDSQPAAAALRQAQLALWQEERTRAPYYWAGFVFAGEWR